jgi:hypothetical protein
MEAACLTLTACTEERGEQARRLPLPRFMQKENERLKKKGNYQILIRKI